MERATGTEVYGCGSAQSTDITLNIQTTTGGNFTISLNGKNTVDHLKKLVSKKLKVGKDRICLLHRERQLREGTLEDNGVLDGARVVLLPSVETGLLSQRPENSVMQALESLNDSQVNDFLSGKSPLNLTMRLGDHMMLIQLQLSTLSATTAGNTRSIRPTPRSSSTSCGQASLLSTKARPKLEEAVGSQTTILTTPQTIPQVNQQTSAQSTEQTTPQLMLETTPQTTPQVILQSSPQSAHQSTPHPTPQPFPRSDTDPPRLFQRQPADIRPGGTTSSGAAFIAENKNLDAKRIQELKMLTNAFDLYRSIRASNVQTLAAMSAKQNRDRAAGIPIPEENEQSPITSLSNLVSSPINDPITGRPVDPTISEEAFVTSVRKNLLEYVCNKTYTGDSPFERELAAIERRSGRPTPAPPRAPAPTPDPSTAPAPTVPAPASTPDCAMSDDSCDNITDQSSFLTESTIDEYPMENLFNSAVDKGLFEDQDETMMDREISNLATTSHGSQEANPGTLPTFQSLSEPLKNKRFQYLLHKTSKFKHPISQNKQKAFMQSVVNKHKKRMQNIQDNTSQPSTSRTEPYITNSRKLVLQPSVGGSSQPDGAVPSTSKQLTPFKAPDVPKKPPRAVLASTSTPPAPISPIIDTRALIEASKNLTQKLKKLSKEVLNNKIDYQSNVEDTVRSKLSGSGAVIESMKHHGRGIYSGTFSGTLNPALQDRFGRPKRDISTIIHILNDLLCASPAISIPAKDLKNACTSTSDEPTKCLCCNQPICAQGKCDGHLPATDGTTLCDHKDCPCTLRRDDDACSLCILAGETCKKCTTAYTLAVDNSKTKCKLDQLRLVMQQKKQRREARKLKTLPYTNPNKQTEQSSMKEEIGQLA